MELGVLGPLEMRGAPGGEGPTRGRERALLAALALDVDRVVSQDALAEALWPGDETDHGGGLKTYVMRLRQTIGTATIETAAGGYRLSGRQVTVDAAAFERAVGRITPGSVPLPASERVRLLEEALAMWRGRPYDELGEWPPAVRERLRLEELHQLALEARSDAQLELGTASIATLEHLVNDQPLRERRWQQLMIGLYRSGRQADALRAFERARVLLRDQLGVDPGVDLASLERAILHHEPALQLRPANALIPTGAGPDPGDGSRPLAVELAIDQAIHTGERHLRAGHPATAMASFTDAAARAREIGDSGRLLRVAISASGEGWNSGLDPHAAHVELLEEAARLPASYSPARARVLARLTVAKSYHEPLEIGRARAAEALDLARLTGDRQTLALALEANLVIEHDPARIEQREAWVDELADLTDPADLTDDGPVAPWVTMLWARAGNEASRGDVDRAIRTSATIEEHRTAMKHPMARMIASMGGVLDASRRGQWSDTRDALAAQRDAGTSALLDPAAMLLAHEGASGLVDSLEGIVGGMSRFTLAPFPVTSGELMLAAGMARSRPTRAEGRAVLDEVRTEAVADVPRDLLWPSAIWALAESTQAVGHADMAGAVYDVARPFGWLTVVNPGGVYLGSMEHHLGVLAATSGATDVAAGHFDAAIEAHQVAGAREWVDRSRAERAAIKPRGRGAPSA